MTPPAKPLQIAVSQHDAVTVCTITGEANFEACPALQAALDKVVHARPRRIVLDLTGLTFICSLALGAIITAHLRLRHHDGQVRIVGPQPNVREVLEVTKLTKILPIYADLKAAIAN